MTQILGANVKDMLGRLKIPDLISAIRDERADLFVTPLMKEKKNIARQRVPLLRLFARPNSNVLFEELDMGKTETNSSADK